MTEDALREIVKSLHSAIVTIKGSFIHSDLEPASFFVPVKQFSLDKSFLKLVCEAYPESLPAGKGVVYAGVGWKPSSVALATSLAFAKNSRMMVIDRNPGLPLPDRCDFPSLKGCKLDGEDQVVLVTDIVTTGKAVLYALAMLPVSSRPPKVFSIIDHPRQRVSAFPSSDYAYLVTMEQVLRG